jgi:hypothetical protein
MYINTACNLITEFSELCSNSDKRSSFLGKNSMLISSMRNIEKAFSAEELYYFSLILEKRLEGRLIIGSREERAPNYVSDLIFEFYSSMTIFSSQTLFSFKKFPPPPLPSF